MLIVRIRNDGTGTSKKSNYDWDVVVTTSPQVLKIIAKGRVEGHDRSQDWTALVKKVIHGN